MIRVLLVEGSPEAAQAFGRQLSALGDIEIVGTAGDARSALELVVRLRPQVICAALEEEGLQLTRQVMRELPTPILMLDKTPMDQARAVEAREAGALEVMSRPPLEALSSLASRLRVLAGVKVFARRPPVARLSLPATPPLSSQAAVKVVAIGASTGGPQALGRLFRGLDATFPWPILCVQHMSHGFLDGMVAWMRTQTGLKIDVARRGERPLPGHVYFAAEDHHLRLRADGTLAVEGGDPVDGHRPSATVLLHSVAETQGSGAIGILLTGMGADGARGLLSMATAGATTMAQDEESSVVFGMPRQAIEMGAVKHALSLDEIGQQLRNFAHRGGK